ncbi:MAG: hypothetical protein NTW70_04580 [Chloroflexi bacterium]|nr:hypothetical protein [Chloroflexota bacterium]
MNGPLRITYPTGWLLAVANTDAAAERGRARAELVGAGGVLLLDVAGPSVATLARPGLFSRFMNLLRHLSTDQAADLIVYEGARMAGRTVIAVQGLSEAQRRALADSWKGEGLHFINYFGGVTSEDWGIWRGPILPELPSWVWR